MSQPQGRNPLVLPLIAVSAVAVLEAILLGVLVLRDRPAQPLAAAGAHDVPAPIVTPTIRELAVIRDAVKALMANGTYNQILSKWGIQSGAIKTPTINGATS